jgi:hypothetical protein
MLTFVCYHYHKVEVFPKLLSGQEAPTPTLYQLSGVQVPQG